MPGNYKSDQMRRAEVYGWHFYVVQEPRARFSKFGTCADVQRRSEALSAGNPRPLRVAAAWKFKDRDVAFELERRVREKVTDFLVKGRRDWVRMYGPQLVDLVQSEVDALGIEAERVAP